METMLDSHNVMKSVCSKAGCKVDGKKPEMVLPAASQRQTKVIL